MPKYPEPSEANGFLAEHVCLLCESYVSWTGRDLADPGLPKEEIGRWLYFAPFVVLSHDAAADPVFIYGNLQALIMFEMSWSELTALPSRLSAEPVSQAERNRLLADVTARGFVEHYSGVRISRTGRRVLIKNVTIWNLLNENSEYCGQAATYHEWIPANRVEPAL